MCPSISLHFKWVDTWSIAPTNFIVLTLDEVKDLLDMTVTERRLGVQVDVLDVQIPRRGLRIRKDLAEDERKVPFTMNVRTWVNGM
jgi:hypothetical protein